jgi:hypothetical protein
MTVSAATASAAGLESMRVRRPCNRERLATGGQNRIAPDASEAAVLQTPSADCCVGVEGCEIFFGTIDA